MAGVFRCLSRVLVSGGARGCGVRCISGKAMRIRNPDAPSKPAPWPYKERPFRVWHRLFDKTTARFDENSKIIVVDGPVAAGKTNFAKSLASELNMLYLPEANLDMVYINEYGYDLRQMDDKVPASCRSYDVKDFCCQPQNYLAAAFQIKMYTVRFSQYVDALAHVLSTGQGVVLDRCAYSDFVFAEAMHECGLMSRGAREVYYEVKHNTIGELMRPHLVIYLDVPVNEVKKRVRERAIWYEQSPASPVSDERYLTAMEHAYKQRYLPEIERHAELLVYDWSQHGDVEVVVEDIERINFDKWGMHDRKLEDWRLDDEEEWAVTRALYADCKEDLLTYFNVPRYDIPELVVEAEDIKLARDVWDTAPGEDYAPGFNEAAGDRGVMFKMFDHHRPTLPLQERIIPASH